MLIGDSEEFRHFYADALNYGFDVLGKQLARIVGDYIARKYGLTPVETYTNPRLLTEALEKSLGYGGVLVETRIAKFLSSGVSGDPDSFPVKIRMGHPEDYEKCVYEFFHRLSKKSVKP